jgi:two-component system sensor histidine kinase CiaH
MFRKARVKLTVWYVLIIMLISISFSVAVYDIVVREVQRFEEAQLIQVERRLVQERYISSPNQPLRTFIQLIDPALEQQIIQRLQIILILVNGVIFIFSTGLCYSLSGKTLRPIQLMIDEQYRFMSDASHELKTPLTAIKTTFEVALRNKDLQLTDAKQLIKENLDEVNNLQTLTNNLLKLSSSQKENIRKYFTSIQLNEVVQLAIKKVTPLAKEKNIHLEQETIQLSVEGIESQLTELVVILLDNAIKYSPAQSKVLVTITQEHKLAKLSVVDQGSGISESDITKIFDRFYRTDKSRSKNEIPGYGLGLSIAQKTAELHSGKIDVKTKVGEGSTFSLYLPIAS